MRMRRSASSAGGEGSPRTISSSRSSASRSACIFCDSARHASGPRFTAASRAVSRATTRASSFSPSGSMDCISARIASTSGVSPPARVCSARSTTARREACTARWRFSASARIAAMRAVAPALAFANFCSQSRSGLRSGQGSACQRALISSTPRLTAWASSIDASASISVTTIWRSVNWASRSTLRAAFSASRLPNSADPAARNSSHSV